MLITQGDTAVASVISPSLAWIMVRRALVEVAQQSIDSIREIHAAMEVDRLVTKLAIEEKRSRKWVLIDALLALGDPGDLQIPWLAWAKRVSGYLSPYQRRYFYSALEKRSKDQKRQAEWDDRTRYA